MPRSHEAFHDLDGDGRRIACEQALDPDGLSTTAHAGLRRVLVNR